MENENKTTEVKEEKKEEKKPPVTPADPEGPETDAPVDFASVIAKQTETIAAQQAQIKELLGSIQTLTTSGANIQKGEKPEVMQPGQSKQEAIIADAKPFNELDFSM